MPSEQKIKRRLRAILSADVQGYSTLMTNDELTTINTLKEYRNVMAEIVESYSGRVVDTPGDNMLAEFPSAVEAVQCSVEIQNELKLRNDQLPETNHLEFRIGINIGDVIQDEESLYGEGINIASRIEGLAEPGGVCISRNVYDQIKNKLNFGLEYIGEHFVKNIKDPVQAYKVFIDLKDVGKKVENKQKSPNKNKQMFKWLKIIVLSIMLIGAGLAGYYWKFYHISAPTDIDPETRVEFLLPAEGPTIAVLPFANMTKDPEQDYFCGGIADNLISTLARTQRILVIDRNSSFSYKGKSIPIKQIGRELNVDYLITGSVQKSDELIRIHAQLISAESGLHIWAERYEKKFKDIFSLQDEITTEVLKAIGIKLKTPWWDNKDWEGISDVENFIKIMKVCEYIEDPTKEGYDSAFVDAKEIIEANPNYPRRYDLLANVYSIGLMLGTCESAICLLKNMEAVKKSLSLDENSYWANLNLGTVFLFRKEYDKAITSIKKSIELNPVYSYGYYFLGMAHNRIDKPLEALESLKTAIRLNPIPPIGFLMELSVSYYNLKQYKKAIKILNVCMERKPNEGNIYLSLAVAYDRAGKKGAAKEAVFKLRNLEPDMSIEKLRKRLLFKNPDRTKEILTILKNAGLPEA